MSRAATFVVAVMGLFVAVTGAFAYGQLSGEADAARPPTSTPAPVSQPVLEQNIDSNGFIRVHEQGTANVNVVSMPPSNPGPFEFTHIVADVCTLSAADFCLPGTTIGTDVEADLTALSTAGWTLLGIDALQTGPPTGRVIYTLSRPVP